MPDLKDGYDLVIVGGGVAGCVLAAATQQLPGLSVLIIEAGADYGEREQDWPGGVLDARQLPRADLWRPVSDPHSWRGKILGGSSCVNGCWHTWGSDGDYDEWAARASDASWSAAGLEPHRAAAFNRMQIRPVADDEISLWTSASLAAAGGLGYPAEPDLAGRTTGTGVGLPPINAIGDLRWNAAFAYLDGCRKADTVQILSGANVEKLRWSGDRVSGLSVRIGGELRQFNAGTLALCAGAFGSPAILQRSGIGDPRQLAEVGVPAGHELPGVGANLSDHPGLTVQLDPHPELSSALAAIEERGKLYASQVSVKAASSACSRGSWDLHLLPTAGEPLFGERIEGVYEVGITAFLMKQRSRGSVRITSADPDAPLAVDHAYLSDPDGTDLQALVDGVELAGELASTPELAKLASVRARPELTDRSENGQAAIRASLGSYWHPVGTCAVGADPAAGAVVDSTGKVHGFSNLYILDASVLPSTPRANTQLSVLAVAGMLADRLMATLR